MAKHNDITEYAERAYSGQEVQAIYSSPAYYAAQLGAHFKATGRSEPRDVRMSRGYSIRANDMRFVIKGSAAAGITFERVE